MGIGERQTVRIGREGFAPLDDLLRQWVTRTIEIGIVNILSAAIRAGVNLFFRKRVLDESKSGLPILEFRVGLEIETSQFPQPMVGFAFDFVALPLIDAKLFVNLFIEVFQKLLASLLDALVNL